MPQCPLLLDLPLQNRQRFKDIVNDTRGGCCGAVVVAVIYHYQSVPHRKSRRPPQGSAMARTGRFAKPEAAPPLHNVVFVQARSRVKPKLQAPS